ncbi:MAG: helix-hairpin-helix domain-containing protein [Gemmatimonadaceae bacterium]|nr:helix-hairpin-helix domain-containing protein [Gemmatimonadaceae bacterium]
MATTSNRAPLLVTLVIVLGVGGRWLRDSDHGAQDPAVASAALDSQLALVEQAGDRGRERQKGGAAPRGSPTKRPRAGTTDAPSGRALGAARERRAPAGGTGYGAALAEQDPPGAPRQERTPLSVVPPEGVARLLADRERQTNVRAGGARSPSTSDVRRATLVDAPARTSPPLSVDVESASAAELERLPRVGPALAQRIVSDRSTRGPFGSIEGLQRVRGIGPAMARQLQDYVTFGRTGRP